MGAACLHEVVLAVRPFIYQVPAVHHQPTLAVAGWGKCIKRTYCGAAGARGHSIGIQHIGWRCAGHGNFPGELPAFLLQSQTQPRCTGTSRQLHLSISGKCFSTAGWLCFLET